MKNRFYTHSLRRLRLRGGSVFVRSASVAGLLLTLAAPALHAVPILIDSTGEGSDPSTSPSASPGPAQPWIGQYGDVATATGNKSTEVPLISWTARGGLPVGVSLFHASESNRGGALGPKWSMSVFSSLAVWTNGSGNVTAYWGDQTSYTFVKSGSAYVPPHGIHDTLINNNGSYDLVTKNQVRYHFIPNGAYPGGTYYFLSSISDENGNTLSINLDPNTARLLSITDPTGRSSTFGYTGGSMTSVTDPANRVWSLNYDANGNLYQVHKPRINGGDFYMQFGYNANHDITDQSDFRGNWAHATYNSDNTVATETDRAGNPTSFSYTATSATMTDANGHSVVHTYDGNGRLGSVTDVTGKFEAYGYDADYNTVSRKDRRDNYWRYTFDGMGNVLSEQDPPTPENTQGNITGWTYNGHSRRLTTRLPSGRSVVNSYDPADNLTQVDQKDTAGSVLATTRYTVSAATHGLVTDKYDANNHHYAYAYDGSGNLGTVTTPLGRQTSWSYNTLGVPFGRFDAMGQVTAYVLDAWDRPIARSRAVGAAIPFYRLSNSDGRYSFLTADLNEYNAYKDGGYWAPVAPVGNLYGQAASGLVPLYRLSYSNGDTLYTTSATDRDSAVAAGWQYSGVPAGYVYPAGGAGLIPLYRAYNTSSGQHLFTSNASEYNGLASPWTREGIVCYLGDNKATTSAYDPDNNLTAFANRAGSFSRTFDTDDRLLGESLNGASVVSHTYDPSYAKGLLGSTTDNTGRIIYYGYTNRNELYQVGNGPDVTTYTYDFDGHPTTVANANGTAVTNVWDNAGRLQRTTLSTRTGSEYYHFGYSYDVDGRRTSADEADATINYGYDGLGHLGAALRSGNGPYNEYYIVDAVGNRTDQTVGGVRTTFQYDADDELVSTTGGMNRAYSYNANGDATRWSGDGVTVTYSYDWDDALTQTTFNGAAADYVDDEIGRRYSRTAGGAPIVSLYDGDTPLVDWQGSTPKCTYLYGNGLVRDNAETVFCDAVGSVRRVTDANGANPYNVNFDSFGNPEASYGVTANPLGWGGQSGYRDDNDAYLIRVGARTYDKRVGRFLTRDTDLTQSPYAYCDGDPVNATDPTGHRKKLVLPTWNWPQIIRTGKVLVGAWGIWGVGQRLGAVYQSAIVTQAAQKGVDNERQMLNDFASKHGAETDMQHQFDIYHQHQDEARHAAGQLAADAADGYFNLF